MPRVVNANEMSLGSPDFTTYNVTYNTTNVTVNAPNTWVSYISELKAISTTGYVGGEDMGVYYPKGNTNISRNYVYEFDETSVLADDTTNYTVVVPNDNPSVGRWIKTTELSYLNLNDIVNSDTTKFSAIQNGVVSKSGITSTPGHLKPDNTWEIPNDESTDYDIIDSYIAPEGEIYSNPYTYKYATIMNIAFMLKRLLEVAFSLRGIITFYAAPVFKIRPKCDDTTVKNTLKVPYYNANGELVVTNMTASQANSFVNATVVADSVHSHQTNLLVQPYYFDESLPVSSGTTAICKFHIPRDVPNYRSITAIDVFVYTAGTADLSIMVKRTRGAETLDLLSELLTITAGEYTNMADETIVSAVSIGLASSDIIEVYLYNTDTTIKGLEVSFLFQ